MPILLIGLANSAFKKLCVDDSTFSKSRSMDLLASTASIRYLFRYAIADDLSSACFPK